jgi:seryl-tRNA(Sec) selenium transferase
LIDVAPAAGSIDPIIHGFTAVPTIAGRIAAGADLVVVDGAGLLGGPACGLIVGRRKFVEQATNHPLASLAAVDPLAFTALSTTLDLYRDAEKSSVLLQVPVWQQLSAPLDNLKQRAEHCRALWAQLQRGPYPVLARECDGALHLDLRTVFPRWDQQLVAAAMGTTPSAASQPQVS